MNNQQSVSFGIWSFLITAIIAFFWLGKWGFYAVFGIWMLAWIAAMAVKFMQGRALKEHAAASQANQPAERIQTDYALQSAMQNATAQSSQLLSSISAHLPAARGCMDARDYENARAFYQKIAYANKKGEVPDSLYNALLEEQKAFARQDWLYQKTLKEIKKVLMAYGALKQTDLYKEVDADAEAIKYTLYFAASNNELLREKSGNTYRVSLPSAT